MGKGTFWFQLDFFYIFIYLNHKSLQQPVVTVSMKVEVVCHTGV